MHTLFFLCLHGLKVLHHHLEPQTYKRPIPVSMHHFILYTLIFFFLASALQKLQNENYIKTTDITTKKPYKITAVQKGNLIS